MACGMTIRLRSARFAHAASARQARRHVAPARQVIGAPESGPGVTCALTRAGCWINSPAFTALRRDEPLTTHDSELTTDYGLAHP
jgi:hypothetical protein